MPDNIKEKTSDLLRKSEAGYRLVCWFFRKLDYFRASIERNFISEKFIDPLKLYKIDPANVKFNLTEEPPERLLTRFSPVIDGDWDKKADNLGNYDMIRGFRRHFNEGVDWEDTDYYSRAKEGVGTDNEWIGRGSYRDMEELENYFQRIDNLYQIINSEGYKTQKEVFKESEKLDHVDGWANAFETLEVTVHIGRNGEFIMGDGWHRLSIAKAMQLDEIPVRIKTRHRKWQEKREKVAKSGKLTEYHDHPDMKNLVEK